MTISAAAEEAVAELLTRLFAQPPCTYTDAATQATVVMVFLKSNSAWTPSRRAALQAGLKQIQGCGLETGPAQISCTRIPREDWAESWKRHFHPLELGKALLLKPSWSRRRAKRGQAVMVLDPGLSFGTGQHPTTRFCLEQIVACRQSGRSLSFLDMGTGSGILAIAAAKLGWEPVEGFDADPEAIRIARANAKRNRVLDRVHLACRDLNQPLATRQPRFDLICANLTSDLLLKRSSRIVSHLYRNGYLVIAGILQSQFPAVLRAYMARGLRLRAQQIEQEWQSAVLTFAAKSK